MTDYFSCMNDSLFDFDEPSLFDDMDDSLFDFEMPEPKQKILSTHDKYCKLIEHEGQVCTDVMDVICDYLHTHIPNPVCVAFTQGISTILSKAIDMLMVPMNPYYPPSTNAAILQLFDYEDILNDTDNSSYLSFVELVFEFGDVSGIIK